MACGDFGTYYEFLTAGQFFDAIYCPFANQMGGVVFALLVFGALGFAIYVHSGSVVIPLILTLILGTVVVTQLPGPAVQIVGAVALLAIAAGGFAVIKRANSTR